MRILTKAALLLVALHAMAGECFQAPVRRRGGQEARLARERLVVRELGGFGEVMVYGLIWGTLANFGQQVNRAAKDRMRRDSMDVQCDVCADTYEIECAACSGKGFVIGAEGPERCLVCGGEGFVPCGCPGSEGGAPPLLAESTAASGGDGGGGGAWDEGDLR